MEDTTAIESLFTTNVLTTWDGEVTTTDRFESTVEKYVAEVDVLPSEDLAALVRKRIGRASLVEPFVALGTLDPRTVAELCALSDYLEPSSDDSWLSLLPVLRLFRSDEMPTDGVPESFIPVLAMHVPHLTQVYSPALVYIWLDDCPPCDTVRADLESVFEESRGVMPFAVYGPDDREFLAAEYDVTAGPALLFMHEGAVDSRLYGAHGRQTVETELARL
jgi:thiol-disulfide isomerase/thioredoxin